MGLMFSSEYDPDPLFWAHKNVIMICTKTLIWGYTPTICIPKYNLGLNRLYNWSLSAHHYISTICIHKVLCLLIIIFPYLYTQSTLSSHHYISMIYIHNTLWNLFIRQFWIKDDSKMDPQSVVWVGGWAITLVKVLFSIQKYWYFSYFSTKAYVVGTH